MNTDLIQEIPLHAQGEMFIGQTGTYVGKAHRSLRGKRVIVIAVHRIPEDGTADDARILTDDTEIGELTPDDVIEFAPEVVEKDGTRRWSWVRSDCSGAEILVRA